MPSNGAETYVNVNVPVNVHDRDLAGSQASQHPPPLSPSYFPSTNRCPNALSACSHQARNAPYSPGVILAFFMTRVPCTTTLPADCSTSTEKLPKGESPLAGAGARTTRIP